MEPNEMPPYGRELTGQKVVPEKTMYDAASMANTSLHGDGWDKKDGAHPPGTYAAPPEAAGGRDMD